MSEIFEILESDMIKTYKISYDNQKIEELKNKIKEYSIIRECEVTYCDITDDIESFITTSPYFDFDEYLGVIEDNNYSVNRYEHYNVDENNYLDLNFNVLDEPLYGGSVHITKKIKLRNYPYLFNILFGKYKNKKRSIYETILLYLNNDPNLVGPNPVMEILNKFCKQKDEDIKYDNNIPIHEKMSLIEILFDSMIIMLDETEFLENIKNQMKIVSKINVRKSKYKEKLLENMRKRIITASENKRIIDSINDYLIKNSLENSKKLFL